jgi:multiple sugar transport system permease protein
MLIYSIVQFFVFYIGININSILLSFQKYNEGVYEFLPFTDLLKNYRNVFDDFLHMPALITAAKNSAILLFWTTIVAFPIQIFVSYSIYKKCRFSGFFTVILMLPSMIPGIVFLMIFRYFIEYGIPVVVGDPRFPSLITNIDTAFGTVIFYVMWLGFAGGLIIYLGAMARIPTSLIEYGQLEGINAFQEIWYVVLPMIFPTITVFVVGWAIGFFTNYGPLYAFYADYAPANVQTIGYYFFVQVIGYNSSPLNYPYASAAGLIFTLIAAPITMTIRWLMEKFGPNPEY